jgi:hypothetical protein
LTRSCESEVGSQKSEVRSQTSVFRSLTSVLEGFAFDLSEIEPAVVAHKIKNSIELPVDEVGLITDNRNTDNCRILAVLMVNFRDRDIKSALEPPDKAFNDAPLSLERGYPVQR